MTKPLHFGCTCVHSSHMSPAIVLDGSSLLTSSNEHTEAFVEWIRRSPSPAAIRVVLPVSIRRNPVGTRLQRTLLAAGCRVTRGTGL